MNKRYKIAIAPNDDGFGTSAWVVGLAHELARQDTVAQVVVIVTERPWTRFHHDKYLGQPKIRPVVLPADCNNIVVSKNRDGTINVPQTVEQCMLRYPHSRQVYGAAVQAAVDFSQLDLVIDLGVPQLVRVAREQQRPTVTLFDHAWSLTLAKIAGYQYFTPEVGVCLDEMRLDESLTEQVVLFEEPVCPPIYHDYWAELVEPAAGLLRGGLGGPLDTLALVGHSQTAALRRVLAQTGQLPAEAYGLARTAARRLLGIMDERPLLFISGGGTAVWDELLTALMDSYSQRSPRYQVVVYNPAEAQRRGVEMAVHEVDGCMVMRGQWGERVTFFAGVAGQTHLPLFPAFDGVLTRAGGGTVNNALVCRVPLLLLEEAGMWQVEQIRQSCVRLGVAEGIALAAFKADPRGCLETAAGELKPLVSQRLQLQTQPTHGEWALMGDLLELAQK
ncbi:MAG: hypothetical protein KDE51_12060 [Anaerolineales bacterium]|nr:hypothetical protein [Anaerolineales bacterium]